MCLHSLASNSSPLHSPLPARPVCFVFGLPHRRQRHPSLPAPHTLVQVVLCPFQAEPARARPLQDSRSSQLLPAPRCRPWCGSSLRRSCLCRDLTGLLSATRLHASEGQGLTLTALSPSQHWAQNLSSVSFPLLSSSSPSSGTPMPSRVTLSGWP